MTEIISRSATTTNPIVAANESKSFSQYSPAPVVKIKPIPKQTAQTNAENSRNSNLTFCLFHA